MSAFEVVLEAVRAAGLNVVERGDGSAMAQCPAHSDGRPSLSLRRIEGSALVYCMAGCSTQDVVAALNLSMSDLFDDERGMDYVYPGGRVVSRTPDKQFIQAGNKADTSLYHSDRITGAGPVFVVEGEKDVLAVESVGGQAVSAPNGASAKPERYDFEPLRGKVVHVVADRDEPGRKRANQVAAHLEGIALSVGIYEPAVGKDAADHIAAGRRLDEFRPITPPDILTMSDALDVWREWRDKETIKPIPTPWLSLNNKLAGGLHPGRLYVVGARTGEGKSVVGQNIASYAAENGHAAFVVSVEMPVTEVMSRVISAQAGIDYGTITKREFGDVSTAIDKYIAENRNIPMFVCDNPSLSIEQIAQKCTALKQQQGLATAFIDYAQLLNASDRRVSRQEQVAHIARQSKLMAMELGISVVLAAQLNRNAEEDSGETGPKLPQKKHLRESGELEQSADVILLLHREKYNQQIYVVVAKNRTGPEATVILQERFDQARIA
ncbi:hypothetical protein MINTM005_13800 [Mycobacterium intracellulare]|uniref:DnaB-like helicase C-terminal domain-containing protein n=1 Tax=Mycobacterium intracellulare TaxID=1767 RepID=UPI00192792F7|nr:DnaB-like helicase C-terminal domain-containing protein [Mycobacterium intracellulare]BCO56136.1 hypothetical protein MINTM005_13800 [Mycobacterium intracellulare]